MTLLELHHFPININILAFHCLTYIYNTVAMQQYLQRSSVADVPWEDPLAECSASLGEGTEAAGSPRGFQNLGLPGQHRQPSRSLALSCIDCLQAVCPLGYDGTDAKIAFDLIVQAQGLSRCFGTMRLPYSRISYGFLKVLLPQFTERGDHLRLLEILMYPIYTSPAGMTSSAGFLCIDPLQCH